MKRLLTFGVVCVLAFAGCGGSDDESSTTEPASTGTTTTESSGGGGGGGGQELTLAADASQLKYDKSTLSASAGTVTITMDNPSPLSHNVAIEGNGVEEKGDVVGKGEKSTVSADLKAGTYTFYCSVDGHEAAGMKGTLTVK
jgi:plastocyanin